MTDALDPEESEDEERSPTPYSRTGYGVAGLFTALPFVSMGGGAALGPAGLLTGLFAAPWRRLPAAIANGGLTLWLVAAFAIWLVASLSWSDVHEDLALAYFLASAAGGLMIALAAGGMGAVDRSAARRAGAAAIVLLFVFASVEARFDFPIGRLLAVPQKGEINTGPLADDALRAVSIALICAWSGLPVLAPRGWRGAVVIAGLVSVSASMSVQFGSLNNAMALGVALLPALLALVWPRATIAVLGQVIGIWIVAAPLFMPAFADRATQAFKQFAGFDAPFPWQARAESWAFIAEKIRERPLWGWGFGSSAHFPDTYGLLGFTLPYIPLHPRNGPLQLWLETGAIGAVLAAGALASFGRRAGAALAKDRWAACAAAGAMASAAVLFNVSAGAWSPWWWGAVAVGAGLIRLARRPA